MKKFEQNYLLNRSGVDEISKKLESYLAQVGLKRENALRVRLTMEGMLLNICEHFDWNIEGQLIIGKRFGSSYLRFRYEGESFDPTLSKSSEDEWMQTMLSNLGLTPTWSYRNGVNEIYLRGPHQTLSSEMMLVGAVVLAVIFGLLGSVLPESLKQSLADYVLNPVSDVFMNALNAFVGIMIFLSVITGICSIGNISSFNKMGKYVIGRMIGFTFLGTGICIVGMIPFFRFGDGAVINGDSQIGAVIDLLVSIVPSNPVTPFAEGNMMQIVFMAVLVGCALLILESVTDDIRKFVQQMNTLIRQAVQWICGFLPYYIFTSLTVMLWENGAGIFITLWKPLLIDVIATFLLFAGKLAVACTKLKLKPTVLLSCLKSTMLIGITTASSSAAFGTMLSVNEKKLGISKKLSQFGTPFANLFLIPSGGTLLAVILYYLSEYYAVPVNIGWFLTAWIMCSIFAMTIPPISGGYIVLIGMLMIPLNIPQDGLTVAGILALIMDFPATAFTIGIGHLELLLDAAHLQLWKREVLEKAKSK